MAVAYPGTIKYNLQRAIEYILNDAKTEGLTYAHDCSEEFAPWEFMETQKEFPNKLRKNLARSWIISFPDWEKEATPELVMKFAKEFMQNIYGDNFQYVIAVHKDKSHLHAHIIYNNVSHITGKSPDVGHNFIFSAKEKSDEICKKYGLSVIIKDKKNRYNDMYSLEKNGKTYTKKYKTTHTKTKEEKYARDRGKSFKQTIKSVIDQAIKNSNNYEEFKKYLYENNIEIKEGKHIAFKLKDQKKFTRGYTIDNCIKNKIKSRYTLDSILERINNYVEKSNSKKIKKVKSKIINLSKNQKAVDSDAYRSWAIKNNIQNISDIFIRMNELNIRNINDINNRLSELDTLEEATLSNIEDTKLKLNKLNLCMNNLNTLNKYSKIYKKFEDTGSIKFYNKFQNEIEEYKKAYNNLDESQRKVSIVKLFEEIESLDSLIDENQNTIKDIAKQKMELNEIKNSLEDFLEIDKDINNEKIKEIEI